MYPRKGWCSPVISSSPVHAMGWVGNHEKWFKALDLIISLKPKVVRPDTARYAGSKGSRR